MSDYEYDFERDLYQKNFDLHNIYIENIERKITNKELKRLFSTFGKIDKIEIKKCDQFKKRGLIQFEKSESAYKAIKRREINDIYIKENWIQPVKELRDFEESCALEHLNDDCLLNLYSYLELQDQLNLAKISNRQKSVFQYYYQTNKTFDINNINLNHITLYAIKIFLMENGKSIKKLNLRKRSSINDHLLHPFYEQILNFVLEFQYCPNIKTMILNNDFSGLFVQLIENSCPDLEHLELNNIDDFAISTQNTELLNTKRNLKLKNFKLLYSVSIIWLPKILNYFLNMEILSVKFDDSYSGCYDSLLSNLSTLKTLSVTFYNILNYENFLESLWKTKSMMTLEILKISLKGRNRSWKPKEQYDDCDYYFDDNFVDDPDNGPYDDPDDGPDDYPDDLLQTEKLSYALHHLIKCNLEKLELSVDTFTFGDEVLIIDAFALHVHEFLKDNNLIKVFRLDVNWKYHSNCSTQRVKISGTELPIYF